MPAVAALFPWHWKQYFSNVGTAPLAKPLVVHLQVRLMSRSGERFLGSLRAAAYARLQQLPRMRRRNRCEAVDAHELQGCEVVVGGGDERAHLAIEALFLDRDRTFSRFREASELNRVLETTVLRCRHC